jgi:hypothetical protein
MLGTMRINIPVNLPAIEVHSPPSQLEMNHEHDSQQGWGLTSAFQGGVNLTK